jgi:WD40 repeat protein
VISDTGDVCLVDLKEHRLVLHDKFPDSLEKVVALCFDPDGSLIAASDVFSIEQATTVRVFGGPEWKETIVGRLRVRASALTLSADGHWIAIGTAKGEVAIEPWDRHKALEAVHWATREGTHKNTSVLKFDGAGERLLIGSQGALEVRSNRSGENFRQLWFQPFGKDSLPFLSEPPVAIDCGWTLMAIAHDGVVEILNPKTFERTQTIEVSDVDGLVLTAQGWLTAHRSGTFQAIEAQHCGRHSGC